MKLKATKELGILFPLLCGLILSIFNQAFTSFTMVMAFSVSS
jgi:hypothetical protein